MQVEIQSVLDAAVSQEPRGLWGQVDTRCCRGAARGDQNSALHLPGPAVGPDSPRLPAWVLGTPPGFHSSSGPSEALGLSEDICLPRVQGHPLTPPWEVSQARPMPQSTGRKGPAWAPAEPVRGPPSTTAQRGHMAPGAGGLPRPCGASPACPRNPLCSGRVKAATSLPLLSAGASHENLPRCFVHVWFQAPDCVNSGSPYRRGSLLSVGRRAGQDMMGKGFQSAWK